MHSGPSTLEPQELAFRLFSGFRLSRAVLVAIRLRLAEALAEGPASAAELAETSGAHAESLERLLDVLTAAGIFGRDGDGRYEITAASQLLRSDHPRSQRAWLELGLGGEIYEAWGALEDAIRTGRTAFELQHGTSWIDYYRDNPEAGQAFAEAMSSSTRAFDEAILAADPFPRFRQVVDVGGSHGSLVRRLLEQHPHARGVIFDLPEVLREVAGLDGRLTAVAGDFFRAVPPGGDLYLLKFILHDWDDERAAAILRRVREAADPGGRVAIVEIVLPDEPASHPGWIMDLNMLAITGGRERSERRHRALFAQSGWRHERTVPTASAISVVLATAA